MAKKQSNLYNIDMLIINCKTKGIIVMYIRTLSIRYIEHPYRIDVVLCSIKLRSDGKRFNITTFVIIKLTENAVESI